MDRALWLLVAVLAAGLPGQVWAQVPAPPYYAMDPPAPLSPRAASPVQQQMLENYRTQLLQSQRDSLQQNPSGLGRDQLQLGNQLNNFNGPAAMSPAAMSPPSVATPAPPFPSIPPGPLFNPAVHP